MPTTYLKYSGMSMKTFIYNIHIRHKKIKIARIFES